MKNEFRGKRKGWGRFLGRISLALIMVFGLAVSKPFPISAEENFELPSSGSLMVMCNSSKELQDAGISIVVDLYKVADVSITSDGKVSYVPSSGFEGISVGDNMSSKEWHDLSQETAKILLDPNSGKSRREPDISGVDLDNRTEIDTGLYLLVARNSTENYVMTARTGDIVTKASTGKEIYAFSPILISVPGWGSDIGEWQYHLEVFLKAEQAEQFGSVKIVKTLQGSDGGSGPVTFVFDVEGVLEGEMVYSNVVSMVFQSPGEEEFVVEKIPAGAVVTVTEIYSGARCSLISDGAQTVVIEADEIVSAAFTNEYDGGHNGGQSITNHFQYEEDGWKLNQLIDKSQG